MTNENSDDLADGWVAVDLDQIAEVRLGRQRSPDRATGPYMRPYMRAANVTWDGISLDDVKEMDFTPEEYEVYGLRKGDILLGEASGSATEVGKPAVWNDEVPGACFQNTLIRVRATADLVPYLYWHFRHDAVSGAFGEASQGINIHHLGREKLAKWTISLPPLAEQRRIVVKVEGIQARIRAVRQTLTGITGSVVSSVESDLNLLERSILAKAFRGELVPQDLADEPAAVLLERIRSEREQSNGTPRKTRRNRT